jgi:hypothetical protein
MSRSSKGIVNEWGAWLDKVDEYKGVFNGKGAAAPAAKLYPRRGDFLDTGPPRRVIGIGSSGYAGTGNPAAEASRSKSGGALSWAHGIARRGLKCREKGVAEAGNPHPTMAAMPLRE